MAYLDKSASNTAASTKLLATSAAIALFHLTLAIIILLQFTQAFAVDLRAAVEDCREQQARLFANDPDQVQFSECLSPAIPQFGELREALALRACQTQTSSGIEAATQCVANELGIRISEHDVRSLRCIRQYSGDASGAMQCLAGTSGILSDDVASGFDCVRAAQSDRRRATLCFVGHFGDRILPDNLKFIARCARNVSANQGDGSQYRAITQCLNDQVGTAMDCQIGDDRLACQVQICAAQSGGDTSSVTVCVARRNGVGFPEGTEWIGDCYSQFGGSANALVMCGLDRLGIGLPPELGAVKQCYEQSAGDASGTGVCLAINWFLRDRELTPEQAIVLQCASMPGAASNPYATGGCVVGLLTIREIQQCWDNVSNCLGPNNDWVRYTYGAYLREAANCVTLSQDCFGPSNFFRQNVDAAYRSIETTASAVQRTLEQAGQVGILPPFFRGSQAIDLSDPSSVARLLQWPIDHTGLSQWLPQIQQWPPSSTEQWRHVLPILPGAPGIIGAPALPWTGDGREQRNNPLNPSTWRLPSTW